MPEYASTILLLFILFSCVYKKHVRDWWWFRFGVISLLIHLAFRGLTLFGRTSGIYVGTNLVSSFNIITLLLTLSTVAALGGLVMACIKHAEEDTEHLHCLKCGYILKGLSEPRCPECGKQI